MFNNQPEERKENLLIKNVNTKTYGKKGRSSLSPEIWNSLPEHTCFGKQCKIICANLIKKSECSTNSTKKSLTHSFPMHPFSVP